MASDRLRARALMVRERRLLPQPLPWRGAPLAAGEPSVGLLPSSALGTSGAFPRGGCSAGDCDFLRICTNWTPIGRRPVSPRPPRLRRLWRKIIAVFSAVFVSFCVLRAWRLPLATTMCSRLVPIQLRQRPHTTWAQPFEYADCIAEPVWWLVLGARSWPGDDRSTVSSPAELRTLALHRPAHSQACHGPNRDPRLPQEERGGRVWTGAGAVCRRRRRGRLVRRGWTRPGRQALASKRS